MERSVPVVPEDPYGKVSIVLVTNDSHSNLHGRRVNQDEGGAIEIDSQHDRDTHDDMSRMYSLSDVNHSKSRSESDDRGGGYDSIGGRDSPKATDTRQQEKRRQTTQGSQTRKERNGDSGMAQCACRCVSVCVLCTSSICPFVSNAMSVGIACLIASFLFACKKPNLAISISSGCCKIGPNNGPRRT